MCTSYILYSALVLSLLEDSDLSADSYWHGATCLPSACCFAQSTYMHNAFHLHLCRHLPQYTLASVMAHSRHKPCWFVRTILNSLQASHYCNYVHQRIMVFIPSPWRRSVSKQVSALGPLCSRTDKQIARLLVGVYKLYTLFSPGSEPSWRQWSECRQLLTWSDVLALSLLLCSVDVHA